MIFKNIEGVEAFRGDEVVLDCCVETIARDMYSTGDARSCITCDNEFRRFSLTETATTDDLMGMSMSKSVLNVGAIVVHGEADYEEGGDPSMGEARDCPVDQILHSLGLGREGHTPRILKDEILGSGCDAVRVWKVGPASKTSLVAVVADGILVVGDLAVSDEPEFSDF